MADGVNRSVTRTCVLSRGIFRCGLRRGIGDGAGDVGLEIGVRLDEFRHVAAGEAQQVVQHQHLAVAVGAGADADRGDRDLAR